MKKLQNFGLIVNAFRTVSAAVAAGGLLMSMPSYAGLTDLATQPLTYGATAAIKPNIMLLLDTSNSMRRTHMPDELETTAATLSLGYKSYQCNILYYNRTQIYQLPKNPDGTSYPTPSFIAAPYDGFNSASATVNLTISFQAYDNSTRQNAVGADTAQAAYYYLHSSGQSFTPTAAPCTDADTNASKAAITSPTGVTGNWTRVLVNSTSGVSATDERQNFAIWYSFYRTRINLAKSAISLAFTPLTSSYRVGFITVLPNVDLAGSGSVDSAYYLPIADFDATQRAAWYAKVFSQTPRGSSPTRQGLARVGRHYAGKSDGINTGMPEDPVLYACQQNFTIATTDGYWNTGAETVGPVKMDGTTQVGQQDGTLTDSNGNTPRPIWDGTNDTIRVSTDKNNQYSYAPCTSNWYNLATSRVTQSTTQTTRATFQMQQSTVQNLQTSVQAFRTRTTYLRSTDQITQSTSQNLASTVQNLRTSVQNLASTTQTLRSTLQNFYTTQQNRQTSAQVTLSTSQSIRRETVRYQRVDQIRQSSSQVTRSTSQNLQTSVQNLQTSVQNLRSSVQNLQSQTQVTRTVAQITQSTSQNLQSTVQNRATSSQNAESRTVNYANTSQINRSTSQINTTTSQNTQTLTQVRQSTSQILSCSSITEICTPVASCTAGGNITCSTVATGPTLVASCTAAAANAGNTYTTTTCTPTVVGPTPVQTCTPVAATSGNSYTTTTCNTVVLGPTPSASCTTTAAASGNSWTATSCNTVPTGPTPVQTCTNASANSGNAYTQTTCNTVTGGPTAVQTCTPVTATSPTWVTTTCTNGNTSNVGVQTCTPQTGNSGNGWLTITCSNPGATNYTNQPVATCTPQTAAAGNQWVTITCPAAVTTSNVPVQTCTAAGANSGNSYTTTTCPAPAVTGPTGVSSCSPITATSGNNWVTTTCGNGNSGPTGVASCTAQTGNGGNSWITITCGTNNYTNTPVQTCTPASPTSGNFYATITCANTGANNYTNTPVQTCATQTATSGNSWVTITCATSGANNYSNTPVQTCTPATGVSPTWITVTCANTGANNYASQPVQTCTPSAGVSPSWITISCPAPATTGPTASSTCTPSSATSGNSWVTTTCANPPANNYTNTPVASCTPQTASSPSWITITCNSAVITAPTAVNPTTCTPPGPGLGGAGGGSPTFYSTTCADVVTDIPSALCVASGPTALNGWTTTTCPGPVVTGPTPVQTCVASGPTALNNYTTTTCANPPATNYANQPVASCAAQTAAAGNSWVTITCPAPVVTGPTAAASCTAAAATAANNTITGTPWTSTSCSTTTGGPTVVDPATCPVAGVFPTRTAVTTPGSGPSFINVTCTPNDAANVPVQTCANNATPASPSWTTTSCSNPGATNFVAQPAASTFAQQPSTTCTPQTGAAGNNWVTITCPAPITTGPTPVQTCTAAPATAANNTLTGTPWTATTCPAPAVTGPTGVASCSPITATAGNSWVTTTCGTNNTANVSVNATCVAATPSAGNGYASSTCTSSCVASGPTALNGYTTTTCPAPTVTGPTAIGTCTRSSGNASSPVTTCTFPAATNYANVPVASCTTQAAASGNSFIAISCPAPVTTTNVPVASCSAAAASAGNSFVTTTCNPVSTPATGVAPGTCTSSSANAGNSFTQTTCNIVNTGPDAVASCVNAAAAAGNSYVATTCNTITTGPILTQTCTPTGPAAGNSFTTTTCPLAPGQKLQYSTVTSITSTPYSGGIATAAPSTTSSSTAVADLDSACYIAGVDSLPAFPTPGKPGTSWTNGFGTSVALPTAPTLPCTTWPCETTTTVGGGVANSLADVAQYYYVTDLRPTLDNIVPATGTGPEDDRLVHQHMTTFTIGLGVSGQLAYRPDYRNLGTTVGDFAAIRAGTLNWPFPQADQPTSIDDFWHAAVNGRGQYFSAGDPTTVVNGLTSALAGVTARTGAGTAAASSTLQEENQVSNFAFQAEYTTQNWSGDLTARERDLYSGQTLPTKLWTAKSLLDARGGNYCDTRTIHLFRSGATNNLTPFTWSTQTCDSSGAATGAATTGLNATEQAYFNATAVSLLSHYPQMTDGTSGTVNQRTPAAGANLVNFVRGQRGYEGFATNTAGKLYRTRTGILGDIVNSQPVYVKGANADFSDSGYGAFKNSVSTRTGMVYVGSNGGMLHAFRAGETTTDVNRGKEEWAFMPSAVLPNVYKLADNNYANSHIYSVDGPIAAFEAYSGGTWKTVLVGGLGGGGKGYYALDVTDPAAPKALWEFNWSNTCYDGTPATAGADCHIGYTYGTPSYGKLNDGTWVALVSSGYNNVNSPAKVGDGVGYLYVLNAVTGKIISKISTGAGNATTPSGLNHVIAYSEDSQRRSVIGHAYGADLLGNLWRFDVQGTILPAGIEATKIGQAKDSGGTPQPITTIPVVREYNSRIYVSVATGELLGTSALASTQTQTVYAIVDTLSGSPVYNDYRTSLSQITMAETGTADTRAVTVTCNGTSAECTAPSGWYADFPVAGERVTVRMKEANATLFVASGRVDANPCNAGGTTQIYQFNAKNGLSPLTPANPVPGTNYQLPTKQVAGLPVGITIGQKPGGSGFFGFVTTGPGEVQFPTSIGSQLPSGKRVTWRELVQ